MRIEGPPDLTVVIPTFNRSTALVDMIASLLSSDVGAGIQVELIVVDDGSAQPAATLLSDLQPPPWCSLRVVRQDNQGVAAARNCGYREAKANIVLFVDDDMLVLPTTLLGHLRAHETFPGSVIFGRSPYVAQPESNPFRAWVHSLDNDPHKSAQHEYVRATIVASGHLSVERTGALAGTSDFYNDEMRTPVAEEYELSHRLAKLGIPVYIARDVMAFHNRSLDVDSFMHQQLSHGRGCSEVWRRYPGTLELV